MFERAIRSAFVALGVPTYLYAISILTQYGYVSYFKLPSNLVAATLKDNVIYFYELFRLAQSVAGFFRWWMWLILVVVTLIAVLFYIFNQVWQHTVNIVAFILIVGFLLGSYSFGQTIAAHKASFKVVDESCQNKKWSNLVIAATNDSVTAFIPIDDFGIIKSGYLIENTTDIGCLITEKRFDTPPKFAETIEAK